MLTLKDQLDVFKKDHPDIDLAPMIKAYNRCPQHAKKGKGFSLPKVFEHVFGDRCYGLDGCGRCQKRYENEKLRNRMEANDPETKLDWESP